MNIEEINYKTLRKIQQIEESNSLLSKIDENLYLNFSNYIKNLNLRLKKENNQQRKIILKNEIINTKKIVKDIYDQREKKILFAIMTKVRGGEPNLKHLIKSEKKLFESILEIVSSMRQEIIEQKKKSNINKISDNTNNINNKKIKYSKNKIFLIKDNIPEFIGTDSKKYKLKKNDIISLPRKTSELLSKRDIAVEIQLKK